MMFQGLSSKYRVVCSCNPKNPDKLFVDICKDGFCSHDVLLKMQKKRYQDDNLERVCNDSRGIMLIESRDGSIRLSYTQHRDVMARLSQEKLRARIDPIIIARFKEMRAEGSFQTICESLVSCNQELQNACKDKKYAESPQEEDAMAFVQRVERLKKLKQIRQAFYARQKYAAKPHMRLMLKQAEYSGD